MKRLQNFLQAFDLLLELEDVLLRFLHFANVLPADFGYLPRELDDRDHTRSKFHDSGLFVENPRFQTVLRI